MYIYLNILLITYKDEISISDNYRKLIQTYPKLYPLNRPHERDKQNNKPVIKRK